MEFIYYFFRNTKEYSDFTIFGPTHILILLIALTVGILLIKKQKLSRKLEVFAGSILLLQQITLYSWYLSSDYNMLSEGLPLYHCRISIISLALGFLFNKPIFRKLGSLWGLLGSTIALLQPGLDPFTFPHITQFTFFIGHLLLFWSSLYCLFVERISINQADFSKIILFTNLYHCSMFILNQILLSNYGYMRVSPIALGSNLPPLLYGAIVILIVNSALTFIHKVSNHFNSVSSLPKKSDLLYIELENL